MNIEFIDAKSILVKNNDPDNWFGISFNMNVYRGCQHDCIYCDSRSECYQIKNFNDLIIKRNAADLLDIDLCRRKKKVTIGTGSMSDPYIPAEKHVRLTQKVLKIIIKHKYPLHITTKSDLILRDLNLLLEINKVFLSVSFTITTCNDNIAKKIEPKAPSPMQRLHALKILSDAGIYTGVLFQPVLPYILDNEENIKDIVYNVTQSGAKYILPWFGVTMRRGQREFFLNKIEAHFPGLKEKYIEKFNLLYSCQSEYKKELYRYFEQQCKKNKILYKMKDVMTYQKFNPYKQLTLFDIDEKNTLF